MNKFQSRLKEALSESGLSQSELGRRAGIDRTVISGYIRGKYKAKQYNLYSIAKVLDVNVAWLMGLDVDKKQPYVDKKQPTVQEKTVLYNKNDNKDKSVDELVDEMHSYRGIKISDAQRASMKAILKAYLDTQIKNDENDDQ